MSEYLGTVTQRPVHPASPVLLLCVPGDETVTLSITPTRPRLAGLILATDLRRGIVRTSSLTVMQPNPHLRARYRGQPLTRLAHCLSRIGIVQLTVCWRSPEPGCVAAHTALQ